MAKPLLMGALSSDSLVHINQNVFSRQEEKKGGAKCSHDLPLKLLGDAINACHWNI